MENNIPQFGTKEFNTFFSDLCDKNLGGNSKNKIKQTAVEWLVKQFNTTINYTLEEFENKVQQAKEMEKKQIIEAHGIKMKGVNNHKCVDGEQYYNETFKK